MSTFHRMMFYMILPNFCKVTCGTRLISDALFPQIYVYAHTGSYCRPVQITNIHSVHFIHDDDILWSVTVNLEECFMGNGWDPHFKNFLFFCEGLLR